LGAARIQDAFQPETGATLDPVAKRFTAPLSSEQRFYRVEDATARTLKSVSTSGNQVTIAFE
jgi:hypothetical protein